MAEYSNDSLGVKFTLPDAPTVGQQLRYKGRVYSAGYFTDDVYLRMWLGFLGLFDNWECDYISDPKEIDPEKETRPKVADVMMWVGNITAKHMNELEAEAVPKNS